MNKEEILNKYIDLIDKGYCSDCNELNCIDNFPHAKIAHAMRELQQENKQLKAKLEMYENGVYYSSENDKLENEIDNLNYIIDKQDKDITILSKGNKQLKENYERIYNENCILREKHNINDIGLLDENYKLKQIIYKSIEYIKSYKNDYSPYELSDYNVRQILEILKGDSND